MCPFLLPPQPLLVSVFVIWTVTPVFLLTCCTIFNLSSYIRPLILVFRLAQVPSGPFLPINLKPRVFHQRSHPRPSASKLRPPTTVTNSLLPQTIWAHYFPPGQPPKVLFWTGKVAKIGPIPVLQLALRFHHQFIRLSKKRVPTLRCRRTEKERRLQDPRAPRDPRQKKAEDSDVSLQFLFTILSIFSLGTFSKFRLEICWGIFSFLFV